MRPRIITDEEHDLLIEALDLLVKKNKKTLSQLGRGGDGRGMLAREIGILESLRSDLRGDRRNFS